MITKILVANRGEIACRIFESAQGAGYQTVAVYSDADAKALFVGLADEAVALGGNSAAESYLDQNKIIQAAKACGADAIHPGYGFLSENAAFSALCLENDIQFIGPSAEAIDVMGNKAAAKISMLEAGVPCIPGYQGGAQEDEKLVDEAKKIGYPLMVKAAAGGGGRGIRLVNAAEQLVSALQSARTESLSAFGSDELILEKAVLNGRHIEIQIAADRHGNVVHLFERDCSAQRRHQKVIEEAPSPFCTETLRLKMGEAAITAAKAVAYEGVGTVEFLVDATGEFYFLEMNTRLQVEHPVTEMITGVDLVDWQFQIADGFPLPKQQDELEIQGHAIEVRIYAEDADAGFIPQTGCLSLFVPADDEGIRIDHGIYGGVMISPYYDAMLAKLIAWGRTREEARRRLIRALRNTKILGLVTNKTFLIRLLSEQTFITGETTTGFIDDELMARIRQPVAALDLALAAIMLEQGENRLQGFSNVASLVRSETLSIADESFKVSCKRLSRLSFEVRVGESTFNIKNVIAGENELQFQCDGVDRVVAYDIKEDSISIDMGDRVTNIERNTYKPMQAADEAGSGIIKASTEGLVIDVLVAVGDTVEKGDTLAVVEAMKMEHRLLADASGEVRQLNVKKGQQVKNRQILVELEIEG